MPATPDSTDSAVAGDPVWVPDARDAAGSRLMEFAARLESAHGTRFVDYDDLWEWTVEHLEDFWAAAWDYFDMRSDPAPTTVLASAQMPGATWFPGVNLNYVSHVFRERDPDAAAVIEVTEDGTSQTLTWSVLEDQVAAVAAALTERGIQRGDRVVGYVPNCAAAIVAFLATASIGAVWSCCGPDYAADAAANRLAQLEPRLLVVADGYHFGGKTFDRREEGAHLLELLPTVEHVVHIAHLGLGPVVADRDVATWEQVLATAHGALEPSLVPFDHPLWVLYSSGTTGIPKGLVHGHGAVTLDYQKHVGLQLDVRSTDRMLWYTTTNWMMWNFAVNMLLLGASMVAYDGSPTYPTPDRLWDIAVEHDATILGASPGYLQACERHGTQVPPQNRLRMIGATGSPVPPGAFHWIRSQLGDRVPLVSMSGGTDIVSALATGAPTKPIWPGELSARPLGVAVDTWDESGTPVRGRVGELVVTKPMPTMPVKLWNDPDGSKYLSAYFDVYPGIWRHGDWATITDRGSVVIHGRSDATLNRNGVRLGSADIYDVVEKVPDVAEGLVVGVDLPEGGYWMVLFVALAGDRVLDDDLRALIAEELRVHASRRHVPDAIIQVPAIPHTRTGKKLEVPIKRILQGADPAQVVSRDAVDDPSLLEHFERVDVPGRTARA